MDGISVILSANQIYLHPSTTKDDVTTSTVFVLTSNLLFLYN